MALGIRTLLALGTALVTSRVSAAPCAPSANVVGDSELVATVGELLARHGIVNEGEGCPMVRARIERRGPTIIVIRLGDVGEERVVSEPATAATVIESWTRSDFETPLLTNHPVVVAAAPPVTAATEPPHAVAQATPPTPSVPFQNVQMFAAAETSFADDRTSWLGAVAGVCVRLGRACAFARGRVATVVDGPGMWDEAARQATDVLIGGDIPFRLGATTLSLGFGAGMGSVHTDSRASGKPEGSVTFGLRADVHLAWTIRLHDWFSIDLSAALDGAEVTDVEGSLSPEVMHEPRVFGRLGAGLRIGGP